MSLTVEHLRNKIKENFDEIVSFIKETNLDMVEIYPYVYAAYSEKGFDQEGNHWIIHDFRSDLFKHHHRLKTEEDFRIKLLGYLV